MSIKNYLQKKHPKSPIPRETLEYETLANGKEYSQLLRVAAKHLDERRCPDFIPVETLIFAVEGFLA